MSSDVALGGTIHPTHTCFDDAIELLELAARDETPAAQFARMVLVHAIVLHPTTGEPYAHAWVEEDGIAWQAGILNGERITYAVAAAELRAKLRVQREIRYCPEEVWRMNRMFETFGPWEPEFLALCRSHVCRHHEREPIALFDLSIDVNNPQEA